MVSAAEDTTANSGSAEDTTVQQDAPATEGTSSESTSTDSTSTDSSSSGAESSSSQESTSSSSTSEESSSSSSQEEKPAEKPQETPEATETPEPTETPEATETPEPTEGPQENTTSEETEETESSSSTSTSSSEEAEEEEAPAEEAEAEVKIAPVLFRIDGEGEVILTFATEQGEEKITFSRKKKEDSEEFEEVGPKEPMEIAVGTELILETKATDPIVFYEWKLSKEGAKVENNRLLVPEEGIEITAVFKHKEEAQRLSAGGASQEALAEIENKPKKTNEELIAEQHIEPLPVPKRDFRFWMAEKQVEFLKADTAIREDIKEDARTVAKGKTGDAVYVLEELNNDWYYIESGDARGFIQKKDVLPEEKRKATMREYIRRAHREASAQQIGQPVDSFFHFAEATVVGQKNEAYLYRKCTTQQVVIDKVYALAKEETVSILEEKKDDARVCGKLRLNALCYVIMDEADGWLYVESGDTRGFVRTEQMQTGKAIQKKVNENGEGAYALCTAVLKPEENKATYYTFTSIKEGVPLHPVRDALIKSAEQCLGHPYVWGGTSLLNGCDCSGFVQGLYAMYGYTIPRVAADQSRFGKQIPVDNAQPGDLIFFAHNGYVHHVALYVGNDQTIEAYGTGVGIIRNGVDHSCAVWATRVLDD